MPLTATQQQQDHQQGIKVWLCCLWQHARLADDQELFCVPKGATCFHMLGNLILVPKGGP